MFLEQDLEQWPYVLEVNAMYSRLRSDGGTSIRELAEFLTEKLGFTISRDRVRTMLKNPMYVTGTAHVNYEEATYPIRPIELINPVPVDIFELNQSLMSAVKGRQRIHPLGHFLLNTSTSATRLAKTSSTISNGRCGCDPKAAPTGTTGAARTPNAGASPSPTRKPTPPSSPSCCASARTPNYSASTSSEPEPKPKPHPQASSPFPSAAASKPV